MHTPAASPPPEHTSDSARQLRPSPTRPFQTGMPACTGTVRSITPPPAAAPTTHAPGCPAAGEAPAHSSVHSSAAAADAAQRRGTLRALPPLRPLRRIPKGSLLKP